MVKFLFRLFLATFLLGVAGLIAILWVFWKWGQDLPPYHQLSRYEPPVASRVHAGNGALLAEFATQKGAFCPCQSHAATIGSCVFITQKIKPFFSIRVLIPSP